jgi:hypothetical protein
MTVKTVRGGDASLTGLYVDLSHGEIHNLEIYPVRVLVKNIVHQFSGLGCLIGARVLLAR